MIPALDPNRHFGPSLDTNSHVLIHTKLRSMAANNLHWTKNSTKGFPLRMICWYNDTSIYHLVLSILVATNVGDDY